MIYERHIIKTLFYPLAITLASIVFLVWLSQIMKLAFIIDLGIGAFAFFNLTFSAIPTIVTAMLPLAFTIACYWGYSFLSTDRELISLTMCGLSNFDLAKPALKLAVMLTLIGYLFSFYISPITYHSLKNKLSYFRGNYISNSIEEHVFNKVANNIILYIDEKEDGHLMKGIIILDHRNPKEPATMFASYGAVITNSEIPIIELHDGIRQTIDKRGDMNQMSFSNLVISIPIQSSIRGKNTWDLQEYNISELFNPEGNFSAERRKQINAEKHQRILWPAYIVAFTMVTLGIFLKHPFSRTGNKNVMVKVIFALSMSLYLHFTFHNLSSKYIAYTALCYVNLLCTTLAGYILLQKKKIF